MRTSVLDYERPNYRSCIQHFNFTNDASAARTISEFDTSTLEMVGAPFEGHTKVITHLALSFDCLLASTSRDDTIKLWAFESRQFLAFAVQIPVTLSSHCRLKKGLFIA
jgi:WD40 repeat protein